VNLLWCLLPFLGLNASQSEPPVERNFFRFGDQLVTLEREGDAAAANYAALILHSGEGTALENLAQKSGALRIKLDHGTGRYIQGSFIDRPISFDPNNIFTEWGRKEHLKDRGCWSRGIEIKVGQFADFILNELPSDKIILTMHQHGDFTMEDFTGKKSLNRQMKAIAWNDKANGRSYFVTTEKDLYDKLDAAGGNVILLNARKVANNGALAVYCARTKRPYIQVECSGNAVEQQKMLSIVEKALEK